MTRKIGRYNMQMHSFALNAFCILLTILAGTLQVAWSQQLEDYNEVFEITEKLPRFQVEIIAFSYNDFNSEEENFEQKNNPRTIKLPSTMSTVIIEKTQSTPKRVLSIHPILQVQSDPLLDPIHPLFYDEIINPFDVHNPQDLAPEYIIAVEENLGLLDALTLNTKKVEPLQHAYQTRFIDQNELELTSALARLNRINAYTVLAHGGWIQEGLSEEEATPIEIWMLDSLNPMGTVKLHLSRFLHITVSLDFYAEESPPKKTEHGLEKITLKSAHELRATRRARSGELHYFDHPAFGILVSVKPAPPEPEILETTDAPLNNQLLEPAI